MKLHLKSRNGRMVFRENGGNVRLKLRDSLRVCARNFAKNSKRPLKFSRNRRCGHCNFRDESEIAIQWAAKAFVSRLHGFDARDLGEFAGGFCGFSSLWKRRKKGTSHDEPSP
jgi:hypothetical protein